MSEKYVDEAQTVMIPPNKWHELSYSQLLDVRMQLSSKLALARGNQVYANPIKTAIARLEGLIAAKLEDPRGLG